VKPNPLAPFPTREGGKFKASLLVGERNGSEVFQIPRKVRYAVTKKRYPEHLGYLL
jgi:hypothetical protein